MKKESAKKESEKKGKKFLKAYFIIALIYAILGLLNSFVFNGMSVDNPVYIAWAIFAGLFSLGIFILSIIAIVIFAKNKWPKITWVLPIYYLAAFVLSFVAGFYVGYLAAVSGSAAGISLIKYIEILSLASSVFELIFSACILYKFR